MNKIINYILDNIRNWILAAMWFISFFVICLGWEGEDLFILKILAFIGVTSVFMKMEKKQEHHSEIDWNELSTKISNIKK